MVIRRAVQHVAEEPQARTERSYRESHRAPRHPSRDARGQQIESRHCPLTTCKVIYNAENNCQRNSCERCEDFRPYGTLSNNIHVEPSDQYALTNRFAYSFTWLDFRPRLTLAIRSRKA